jgi:hypothetical protein
MIRNTICPGLFLTLVILLFTPEVSAQKFSLGVRAGASVTWPGFGDKEAKDEFSRGFKPGYHGGLFISFPLKNHYEVVIEGGASQKGRIIRFNDSQWRNNLTLYMADMGMQLRKSFTFRLKKNTPADAFISVGPEINYWFHAKGKIVVEGKDYPYAIKVDEESTSDYHNMYLNDVNRWLFGLGIGFGMKAPLGPNQSISTEFRFGSGHTFLGKKESSHIEILGFADTFKTNLKTLSVSVAYSFDFDRIERRKGKSNIKKRMKRS